MPESTAETLDPERIVTAAEGAVDAMVVRLSRLTVEGDSAAATALDAWLERHRDAQALQTHRNRLDTLQGDPLALVEYLAEIGESETGCEFHLARDLTDEERIAHERGRRRRTLEARVLQLRRARGGKGPVEPWMVR